MPRRLPRARRWVVLVTAVLGLAPGGASPATAGDGLRVEEVLAGTVGPRGRDSSAWVFVSLPHPTTRGPYLTQPACEAARLAHGRGATMGCHLEPLFSTAGRAEGLQGSQGER